MTPLILYLDKAGRLAREKKKKKNLKTEAAEAEILIFLIHSMGKRPKLPQFP